MPTISSGGGENEYRRGENEYRRIQQALDNQVERDRSGRLVSRSSLIDEVVNQEDLETIETTSGAPFTPGEMFSYSSNFEIGGSSRWVFNSQGIPFQMKPQTQKNISKNPPHLVEYETTFSTESKAHNFLKRNPQFKVLDLFDTGYLDRGWKVRILIDENNFDMHSTDRGSVYITTCKKTMTEDHARHDFIVELIKAAVKKTKNAPDTQAVSLGLFKTMNKGMKVPYDMLCDKCGLTPLCSKFRDSFGEVDSMLCCTKCMSLVYHCAECSSNHFEDVMERRVDGSLICATCAHARPACASCGDYLRREKSTWKHHKNTILCDECYGGETCVDLPEVHFETVYHHENYPWRHFYRKTLAKLNSKEHGEILRSSRSIGVELEILFPSNAIFDKFCQQTPGALGIGTDGSLSTDGLFAGGIEIRTPKIAGLAAEKFLTSIGRNLIENRWGTNSSCGYHIHLDGADFLANKGDAIKRLFSFYHIFEPVIESFLPKSRRNNRYCRSLSRLGAVGRSMQLLTLRDVEKMWYGTNSDQEVESYKRHGDSRDTRYYGANFHSLLSRGHLEIRYHSGTINPRKILEWANLHTTIMDKVMNNEITLDLLAQALEVPDRTELFLSLLNLPERSEAYFRERQNKFSKVASPLALEEQFNPN